MSKMHDAPRVTYPLLHMPWPVRGCRLLRRCRREAQCRHEDGAHRPVLGIDIGVAAQVQIAGVAFPGREEEADLRAHTDRSALVVAEFGASATVAGDLLIDIADQAGMNALTDELRGCPIG